MVRKWPNIVITGTPGTGKSTLSSMLVDPTSSSSSSASTSASISSHLHHINVSSMIRQRKDLQVSYDEEWDAFEVDEDLLLDELEKQTGGTAPEPVDEDEPQTGSATVSDASAGGEGDGEGGLILDWHTNEIWPERWVDLVVVLRTDHSVLWQRLESRGYPAHKIQENNQAEIMQTVLEEARGAYPNEAIVELQNNNNDELEENAERLLQWIIQWRKDRGLA
ncbi:P-loop containing nucleoside triphosphate hydrolase protein [Tilletiaria anomala UBC 951]|uniref:Adenylate kinase isoenzyme 6 homolog n=1 Tax=Tilletiaria anomala (strain ATCC 24038 / CBS 436.72 / UBC 951) TaxID=1037660 RepID=A0A066WBS7_TILAU|nr:P-loop containing nucleoside triphosphate hydrolase protein [Tilletiaria anomala UBC 951]KDN48230.1 P-loop containing nucleoside triphosphate hydrolase protein [Tilletiaria anomala UBC 951]